MKEWALGWPGFILAGVAGLATATGQEVSGHGHSGLQKSQPVPSLPQMSSQAQLNGMIYQKSATSLRSP